jgi:hypothetical protein
MTNPVQSETDAFQLTIGAIALAVISVVIGWVTAPELGLLVFLLAGGLSLAVHMSSPARRRRMPLRKAALAGAGRGTARESRQQQVQLERLRAELDVPVGEIQTGI